MSSTGGDIFSSPTISMGNIKVRRYDLLILSKLNLSILTTAQAISRNANNLRIRVRVRSCGARNVFIFIIMKFTPFIYFYYNRNRNTILVRITTATHSILLLTDLLISFLE